MRACTSCRKILSAANAVCPDDQSAAVEVVIEPLPVELQARFGAFQPFAVGASGTLWRGQDDAVKVAVILKLLSASHCQAAGDRARTRRELRKQLTLPHPHLPQIYDEGEIASTGRVWFAREFVPGETLAQRLRRTGALSVPDALAITAQLAYALDVLHRQGLAHRDVKPGHVILRAVQDGRELVQLIDAGIGSMEARNSASYMAPEIAAGAPASFRSDLYALGSLSYELLTGSAPFQEVAAEAVLAAPKTLNPPALANELPAPARTLLASLLAKDPRRRPFSAQQVRRTLEPFLPAWVPAIPARSIPSLESSTLTAFPRPSEPAPRAEATVELSPDDLESAIIAESGEHTPPEKRSVVVSGGPTNVSPNFTQELELADIEAVAGDVKSGTQYAQRSQEPASKSSVIFGASRARAERAEPQDPSRTMAVDLETQLVRDDEDEAAGESPADNQTDHQDEDDSKTTALGPESRKTLLLEDSAAPAVRSRTARGMADVSERTSRSARAGGSAQADVSVGNSRESSPDDESTSLKVDADDVAQSAAAPSGVFGSEAPDAELVRSFDTGMDARAAARRGDATSRSSFPPIRDNEASSGVAADRSSLRATGRPPLSRRPSLLLWGAAALLLAAAGVRLLRGPGSERTSASSTRGAQPPQRTAAHTPEPAAQQQPGATQVVAAPAEHVDALAVTAIQPDEAAADTTHTASVPQDGSQTMSAAEASRGVLHDPSGLVRPRLRNANTELDARGRARLLYQEGKYREAAEAYKDVTAHGAPDAAAYAGLGASWLAAGEPERAVAAYERAVQIKPAVSGFQAALGRAYLAKGDRDRARAAYAKALSLDPGNQAARNAVASLNPPR